MRILPLLTLCVLGTGLVAQTTYQEWSNHPGVTSWTSRASVGTGSGSIFMGVHASTNRGVMDVGGLCDAAHFRMIMQDQNCTTRERYDIEYRGGSDAAGPSPASGALLGGAASLLMPTSTSTGSCAWNLTTVFTTPVSLPCTGHWAFGVQLNAAPNWTTDGNSIHGSAGAEHNAHLGSNFEDHCWQIVGTATAASHPSSIRSFRMYTAVADGAVMNLACGGREGYGGTFPVASPSTAPLAWDARLYGGANCSGAGSVVAVHAGGLRLAGFPFGIGARLYILPSSGIFFGPTADAQGQATVPLLPFLPSIAAGAGTFHLQGALGATTGIKLTNSQAVIP